VQFRENVWKRARVNNKYSVQTINRPVIKIYTMHSERRYDVWVLINVNDDIDLANYLLMTIWWARTMDLLRVVFTVR